MNLFSSTTTTPIASNSLNRSHFRRTTLLAGAACLLLTTVCFSQATNFTSSGAFHIQGSTFTPCAAGGAGEVVDFSGTIHVIVSFTFNSNRVVETITFNNENISGTGETTGAIYHAPGVSTSTVSFSNTSPTGQVISVDDFYLIGTTPTAGKLLLTEVVLVTINPDGTLTFTVEEQSVRCV